jgi:hypothetical protein
LGALVAFVLYGAATLQAAVLPIWYGVLLIVFLPVSLALGLFGSLGGVREHLVGPGPGGAGLRAVVSKGRRRLGPAVHAASQAAIRALWVGKTRRRRQPWR